jgi:PTS system nitrogen regulatory IIA component
MADFDLAEILDPGRVRAKVDAHSRKRALEEASRIIAESIGGSEAGDNAELSDRVLFDALMARERLGSTCIGGGVAIPHCRMDCSRIFGAFVTLEEAVDFEAADEEPVDEVFVLIVPESETESHLKVLGALARLFMDAHNRSRLRACATDTELFEELIGQLDRLAA